MINLFNVINGWIDGVTEKSVRKVAQSSGRRSFLAWSGRLIVGGAMLPALPFDRLFGESGEALAASADGDANACDYWRYCALDGYLCNSCGGSVSQCPPGSETAKVAWVGTCTNPNDGKHYLISYADCCGKVACTNSPFCNGNLRERPGYRMGLHNDINWCMANTSKGYHCTIAARIGISETK